MESNTNEINFTKLLIRYFSFWPYYIISVLITLSLSFIYLRYAEYQYYSDTVIEVIDKSQDSEMALPTSMTIFNRSMINLNNEIGRLKSFDLNRYVTSTLKSNVRFFSIGIVKTKEESKSSFFKDYNIEYKIDSDTITKPLYYQLEIENSKLSISFLDIDEEIVEKTEFNSLSSLEKKHNFPFEISIDKIANTPVSEKITKRIIFYPFNSTVIGFMNKLSFDQNNIITSRNSSSGSDQIKISMTNNNVDISKEYLTTLINSFDKDGIEDRQLEYKRTIEFVDNRSIFLQKELSLIEKRKQDFKRLNKLTDISSDASISINQQFVYDSELFEAQSQKDLLNILSEELDSLKYELLPVNIGLNNNSLNNLISQYNVLIKERNTLIGYGAGIKNSLVINKESQINNFYNNILTSIENYRTSLEVSIDNIVKKEKEFENFYYDIPENEKILRSIDRELEIKEALYLLLLQKKEEASINFAVVKPTIKIVDSPKGSNIPVYPVKINILIISLLTGLLIPIIIISIWFYFDNKIHIKGDLEYLNIPVVGEVPFTDDDEIKNLDEIINSSRLKIHESIRMLIANLNYFFRGVNNDNLSKSLLITSSVKGEGKTLISTHISKLLSFTNKRTILVGADLRNPQIHKFTEYDKSEAGLSNYLSGSVTDWKSLIKKSDKLDIFLSGAIPPNPTELLESKRFADLIKELKSIYEYVIIDSAPCLLVADTLQFSKNVDGSLLIVRSNQTSKDILKFIDSLKKENKLNNMHLVLNGVGNSQSYGYKYGYQYGYKYGYNYGYGYGYGTERD